MRRKTRLDREIKIGSIIIRYNRRIENHIAKHNVTIGEIQRALEQDYLIRNLGGRDWVILCRDPVSGRYLVVFLHMLRKLEFRLKTAREMTESEKRFYKKKFRR